MNTNKLPNAKTMTEEEYVAAKNAFDAKFGAILTDPENPFAPSVPLVLTDPKNPDSPALNDFVPFDDSELDACYACSDNEMSEMSATSEECEARRKAYEEEMEELYYEHMGFPGGYEEE